MNLLLAAFMGLVYVAPPGPVNIETARHVAKDGTWAGFSLQLGSLLGDALYAVLGLVGVDLVLTRLAIVHAILGCCGIGLLLYLAWSALHEAWRGLRGASQRQSAAAGAVGVRRKTFWIGLVMSVSSPFGLAYWVSVGGVTLQRFQGREAAFLSCFLLAELLWALVLPTILGHWREIVKGRFFDWVLLGCGLIQMTSALTLGYALLSSLA